MAIVRVQSISGDNGAGATTVALTLGASPTNGNLMVATIVTAGATTGRVSSITQTGATWVRATEIAMPTVTTEIWYAENVSGAGTGITVNLAASLRAIATAMEYSGMILTTVLDKTATNSGTRGIGGGGEGA